MFTLAFWKGAGERAIKTVAQALLGSIVITAPIIEQPWLPVLGIAATSGVVSILTSLLNPNFVAGAPKEDELAGLDG